MPKTVSIAVQEGTCLLVADAVDVTVDLLEWLSERLAQRSLYAFSSASPERVVPGSFTGSGSGVEGTGIGAGAGVGVVAGAGTGAGSGAGMPGRGGNSPPGGNGSGAGKPAGGGKSGVGRGASLFLDFFPLRRPNGLTSSQGMGNHP